MGRYFSRSPFAPLVTGWTCTYGNHPHRPGASILESPFCEG
jgi:hypothetical protein